MVLVGIKAIKSTNGFNRNYRGALCLDLDGYIYYLPYVLYSTAFDDALDNLTLSFDQLR